MADVVTGLTDEDLRTTPLTATDTPPQDADGGDADGPDGGDADSADGPDGGDADTADEADADGTDAS
jgi:hypothetical protein